MCSVAVVEIYYINHTLSSSIDYLLKHMNKDWVSRFNFHRDALSVIKISFYVKRGSTIMGSLYKD